MIARIPQELKNLYQAASWKTKLYLELRWRLCPFEKIESYLPRQGKILDLGCGYGILANFLVLKSEKREVIGIDFSSKRIAAAALSVRNRKNIRFLKQDIKDIAWDNCEGVIVSDFLHHISPATGRELLETVYKKLNNGGRLVIQDVDNRPRWKFFLSILADGLLNIGKPIYFRSAAEWKKLLEEIGFKVTIVPAHQHLFIADVLLIGDKKS